METHSVEEVEIKPTVKHELIHRFKGLRRHLGISQVELSNRTGIPQTAISKMETGVNQPTIDTIEKLYIGLGYTVTCNISKTRE